MPFFFYWPIILATRTILIYGLIITPESRICEVGGGEGGEARKMASLPGENNYSARYLLKDRRRTKGPTFTTRSQDQQVHEGKQPWEQRNG